MDWLDWIMWVAGGGFGLLTLGLGYSRASAAADRDINPAWRMGFIVLGSVWAVALVIDYALPIETSVYLANGGDQAVGALLGKRPVCIPAKSYQGYVWRFDAPDAVTIGGAGGAGKSEPIGKGTWFINLSNIVVSADMYERTGATIDFDALFSTEPGAIRINSRFGAPFRLFTQAPLNRMYSAGGDVTRRSIDGPCPAPSAPLS